MVSFQRQTVIVTGSNTGLGYETVKHLIRLDAEKIIIAVRSLARGQAAVERLIAETRCDPNRLDVWIFDLGSHDSIRQFVARANTLERLDAVIQNAGVADAKGTIDGIEATAQINFLAPLYFAYAILPKLRESAKKTGLTARFTFNGSDIMYALDLPAVHNVKGSLLEVISDPAQQTGPLALGFIRYALTKTLLFLAVHAMAKQSPVTATSNVIIDVVTPGMTVSDFGEDRSQPLSAPVKALKTALMLLIARKTEVGARTLVHAAAPDLDPQAHGSFLMDCKVVTRNPVLNEAEAAELEGRLQKEVVSYLEKLQPGVTRL